MQLLGAVIALFIGLVPTLHQVLLGHVRRHDACPRELPGRRVHSLFWVTP